jgi:hypothetical protein
MQPGRTLLFGHQSGLFDCSQVVGQSDGADAGGPPSGFSVAVGFEHHGCPSAGQPFGEYGSVCVVVGVVMTGAGGGVIWVG